MVKITILIVDDHTLIREAWACVLNSDPHFRVIGETGSGEESVTLSRLYKPNIVLMDISLPGMNGYEATKLIRNASPQTKIIGISLHTHPTYAKQMMSAGASGYITKNSTREEMIKGLKEVAKGNKYVCEEIKNILSEQMLSGSNEKGMSALSSREREVVKLLATGASSRQIGEKLYISKKTVEVHRTNILRKLEVKNVAALVNYINKNGI